MIDWIPLHSIEELDAVLESSKANPVMILKHSTSCSISAMAKNRLERTWVQAEVPKLKAYYLDLLKHRAVSNLIAETLNIAHQSPQILLIKDGICIHNSSHMAISFDDIKNNLSN